ncbi:MAG: hypothetical protein EHM72_19110, partial [Calditrichaeota bacterium]
MKLVHVTLSLVLLFCILVGNLFAVTPLTKGVNLGDWLSTDEDYEIQTTRYQPVDFQDIKALGFDYVRILVNFNTSGMTAEYAISPIQMMCLDNAMMWAEQAGLKVVIANEGGEILDATATQVAERVAGNWKDVAGHFAAKGNDAVLYEIFASPGDLVSAENWNTAAAAIIAAIRQVDTKHTIIVGPVGFYAIDQLTNLQKFSDDNVLYAFEMNEPAIFTRQNGSYRGVTYNTSVIPFPYSAGRMPTMNGADAGTPSEEAYNQFPTQGTVEWVKGRVDAAAQVGTDKGMPLWCVSMGVTAGVQWDWGKSIAFDVPAADRAAWLDAARTQMEAKGIGWTLTNYRGNYSVFDQYENGTENWMKSSVYPYDVNSTITAALGLTAPPADSYSPTSLEEGIVLFDDEFNPVSRVGFWLDGGLGVGYPDFFVTDNPLSGKYCMGILYPGQYNAVDMFFYKYQDMLTLAENGYVLDFFIRCDNDAAHIEPRFEMTNEFEEDRPWRMNKHIDNSVVPFDGEWQRVTLPLLAQDDQGAWDPDDRLWYGGPGGLIDWSRVQRLQFVSETADQPEAEIFIDRVRIVDPVTLVKEQGGIVPGELYLAAAYPNPFN